jgi:YVTN family beta-propeller protein
MRHVLLTLLTIACLVPKLQLGNELAAAKPQFRRPVGIAVSPDGRFVYTANRRSGTVSVVDTTKPAVVSEIDVAGRLSGLALLAGGKRLLTTDEQHHELVLLSGGPVDWKVAARLKVAAYPVDVVASSDGNRCYVSSLWSRSVTVVGLAPSGKAKLKKAATIRLPFVPGRLCLARQDSRLIVAASFAGSLGVIDTNRNELTAVKDISSHNIRGLAGSADGTRLLTTQQSLNSLARSTFDDVHWGNMMVNVLYSLSLDDVCRPKADPLRDRQETHLGAPENGAGDPGAIAVAKGRLAIVLSGVHEVAVSRGLTDPLARIPVGKQPTAVAISPDGKRVFVADTFSDAVSLIDADRGKRIAVVSLGPQPKPTPADRGEQLFFDARLSHDGWMSCHSCHSNGHTNGLLNDNLSDGSFGAPKRVLSLLGVSRTGPWAWNGKVASLERQVRNSVTKTMRGKSPAEEDVAALVAYLKTLKPPPPPSKFDARSNPSTVQAGARLFARFNCRRCHTPPTYTSKATYDVGLKDAVGNSRFNPPSLRGVGWRRSLFHDGRARSLKDVFARHRHQLPRKLSKSELEQLVAFLRSL